MLKLVCAVFVLFVSTSACVGAGQYVWVDELTDAEAPPPPVYRIKPGDGVQVRVWRQAELSVDAEVRPDGNITIPLVGDIALGGLSAPEAAEQVASRIKAADLMVEPNVSVAISSRSAQFVTVIGEVRTPGKLTLEKGDTLLHVLGKAGGLNEFADDDGIYVVRQHGTPSRIRFSYRMLTRDQGKGLAFQLQDGDVVVVEP
jgi:polysaccharide export outer membrane protein